MGGKKEKRKYKKNYRHEYNVNFFTKFYQNLNLFENDNSFECCLYNKDECIDFSHDMMSLDEEL